MNKHRFVWHDLNTKDVETSKRFYGEIFGWKFSASDHGPYVHIEAGSEMIGGMRQMSPHEPQPASWLGYIGVDDVAATVGKITASGGKIYMPTTTMDKVGTFAVTADPTGGVFAPWKSARAQDNADVERKGPPNKFTFCWDELVTTDPAAATKFYSSVFGWQGEPMDMGGGMTYTLFQRPGVTDDKGQPVAAGGMMKSPPGMQMSFWMAYVAVDSCDQRCAKAEKLGAKVMVGPQDIPNVGRFAAWSDPSGAAIAILQPAG